MELNPLLFCPSVRNIGKVRKSWQDIPYDKYVVRYKLEDNAYSDGRDTFLDNKKYTHLVICPDDLVIDYDSFMILKRDVEEYDFNNIAGVANLDESQPDVYSCKAVGIDPTSKEKGSYLEKSHFIDIHEPCMVGFTGFACQWIERSLVEQLSFTGGCNNGKGCMDLQFTREMDKLGIGQIINPDAFFYHMRNAQHLQVRKWKGMGEEKHRGWSYWIESQ